VQACSRQSQQLNLNAQFVGSASSPGLWPDVSFTPDAFFVVLVTFCRFPALRLKRMVSGLKFPLSAFNFQFFLSIGIYRHFSAKNQPFFPRSVFLSSNCVLKSLRG
jgi:hypothetical protein